MEEKNINFCSNCGQKINEDNIFCSNCGYNIRTEKEGNWTNEKVKDNEKFQKISKVEYHKNP